ncbi:hypothetical protein AAG906_002459 [Vitis piasezkii]|uniref:DUF1677 domain-containing protein n=1 Tax=Vitis vinifera TaxID=29760 RepID=A0ABY9BQ64_VITVI|nr:uncharacterized protein LOC100257698 [Vitis vinifera]WJZ84944.1 hypothetical protein VitviT2T_004517 [Vitis vinifera]WJZ84945.1 hypothetical protein VitviT2T_004517 [Vitis vinifera]|eukprot:XP_002280210.1 PREDICTED: uncharacterized protein LOC100257698 [Vitis vinifera]
MAATVEAKAVSGIEIEMQSTSSAKHREVEFAKCDCCGLTEECTIEYIERVRERYQGRWICGLCAEAIKDEIVRSKRLISAEEALNRHMNFFKRFRSSNPPNHTESLISAVKQLLLRTLDSPRSLRKGGSICVSSSSESCLSSLDGSTMEPLSDC